MSMLNTVKDMQNQTAWQMASDHAQAVANSSKTGTDRTVGGIMGKHDFLMLLSAQLRYQDPLEPQSDADFASGLAQFSSLEQMQNMNTTLETMASFQSYSLIGKFVVAETVINGSLTEIPGVVDSIFMSGGVTMAQIGEYMVPITSIKEVFDTNNILTSEMLLTASNNLIGRTVVAEVDGKDIEGIVTRVLVDKGSLLAQIDDGTGEPKFVPVNSIVDIRETGTVRHTPKPETPPDAKNWKSDGQGGFYELCEKGETELGLWTWDVEKWEWVYTSFGGPGGESEPESEQQAA
ncbi:MAG: hypothetical protein LBD23_16630 [Oscillospiraceae bacterium]|nr:hypothetical protein [Oscillospiraceae bacterium]